MRTLIFILSLLLIPPSALAIQDIPLDVSQLDISFERNSHNSVIATAQDSRGFIWLASVRGLHVYDGKTLRPVLGDVLQGTNVGDMLIDGNDVLWVGTNSGILAYSLKTMTPRWYKTTETSAGRSTKFVKVLRVDQKGSLWAGTSHGGLHRYEPSFDRFEMIDISPPDPDGTWTVFDIAESPQRDIWLATGQGVLRLTGARGPATAIPLSTGESYTARAITFDGAGNLFVGLTNNGLWTLAASAQQERLVAVEVVPSVSIRNLYTDSSGDVWISTRLGLYRHSVHKDRIFRHSFRILNSRNKAPANIASIAETRSGTLWIGTYNHGLVHRLASPGAKLLELRFKGQSETLHNVDAVCTVNPADSRIYVAPRDGKLYRSEPLDAHQLSLSASLELEEFLDSERIHSLAWTADQSLVCGIQNAVLHVGPNGETQRIQLAFDEDNPGLLTNFVRHIAPMGDGRIWFSNNSEVYSWRPGESAARREMTVPGNAGGAVLLRAGSDLWVGHGRTLDRINIPSGRKDSFTLPIQIPDDETSNIKSLLATNSEELIVGATKQLYRFDLKSKNLTPLLSLDNKPIASVLSLWSDSGRNVWLHTVSKVFQLPFGTNQVREMVAGSQHPASSITSEPTALGSMLIYGHTDGLLIMEPQKLLSRTPTLPKISNVRIFDRPVSATPLGRMPESLELDHQQHYLTFSFSVPEKSALGAPHFLYMLEGVDATWNDAGTQTSVSYAHLRPGRYVFHLKDGLDGSVTDSMSITIRPPWWLTAWAKTGYALGLVLTVLLSSLLFARLQTTRIRKDMLENLVMLDPLTGVPNRRKFQEVLAAEKSRCKRSNHQISVLMIDIDYFKGFNDRFGHQAGDEALSSVAKALSQTLMRPEDFVGRYGGEEFVIVLPSTNRSGAERVAQKIQQALFMANIPYPGSPLSDRITVSLGISTFSPQSDLHIDSGLFSADQALYQAKRNGRNCFFYKDHCLALTPVRQ
ncbi:MAG: diguanylate cyclase [Desulfomicrobium sp.]|nr:diguanylate cyclase [Pseudomonadota bacterium]MBV1711298.1 diguanylate cyclase [Desulfomicrobium sp.]MBU4569969.1 diguanylate cyclase [Pseudomonadota bacterium]MBU4595068.1 diguanylate cyclase [Pseudomonadota bacterium]MBV1720631.1 diguanylate cyclase [Desulfomicrobium sp.]